eukprot:1660017-Pyramimonas_sp.AAC.1
MAAACARPLTSSTRPPTDRGPQPGPGRQRARRPGGAWRAFTHEMGTFDIRAAAARYRALPPEERERLREEGRRATLRVRAGSQAFPPRALQLRNQRNQNLVSTALERYSGLESDEALDGHVGRCPKSFTLRVRALTDRGTTARRVALVGEAGQSSSAGAAALDAACGCRGGADIGSMIRCVSATAATMGSS